VPNKKYDYVFEGCCKAGPKLYERPKFISNDFEYNSNLVKVSSVTLTFDGKDYAIRVGDFNTETGMLFLYADCVSVRDSEGKDTTFLFMHFIRSLENTEGNFIIVIL